MFKFEDPKYLYLLVFVVLLALVHWLTHRSQKKRLRKFGDMELVKQLMPLVSKWRPAIKFWLLEAALALLIVMLARPQFGRSISESKTTGIECVIAFDVSNSMRAKDNNENYSRLQKAKMMLSSLIDKFVDDKVAVLAFAGDAYLQLPITSDHISAKNILDGLDPSLISNQGTNIAAAIQTASDCFSQNEHVGKAIILLTDGEDHEGAAEEAAKLAKEEGRVVYVLGIGSTKGSLVPDPEVEGSYMTDDTGTRVMSSLNETMCSELAQAGGGVYIHVDNIVTAQKELGAALDKLEKAETTFYSDFDEQFQAVGLIVLLLLIIEICIQDRRNPTLKKLKLFKR